MRIIFSSSVRMAAEFAEVIAQRDDVWNVKCTGLDVSFTATSNRKLHKFAQDFERAWLERKIAEAEAAMKAAMPAPPIEPAPPAAVAAEVKEENLEGAEALADPVIPLAATVGLASEGYLLGIEDGAELEGEEEEDAFEDFVDDTP